MPSNPERKSTSETKPRLNTGVSKWPISGSEMGGLIKKLSLLLDKHPKYRLRCRRMLPPTVLPDGSSRFCLNFQDTGFVPHVLMVGASSIGSSIPPRIA